MMPFDKSKSTLAKKYGSKNVARARDLMQARMKMKPGSEKGVDKLPWGIIGAIAKNAKEAGKIVTKKDIQKAAKTTKRKGIEPSLKRNIKKQKNKKVKEIHIHI